MNSDGTVMAKLHNPVVPEEVLRKILSMKQAGTMEDDIIESLRQETVPPGKTVHDWIPGYVELFTIIVLVVI